MPTLTGFLQQAFSRLCPQGWICQPEAAVLSGDIGRLLGYTSRADVLLAREDGSRRLWIEFEISRADPVANHAKFATTHLFQPWQPSDTFISMVSPHVVRGRRNLSANTITLMRRVGIQAFQVPLFPTLDGPEIKRLNHLSLHALSQSNLDVRGEIQRVYAVSEPVVSDANHRIHFAANLTEVMLNVHQWHLDMGQPEDRAQWGRRTVTYFVYDPRLKRFTPSKFCAFLAADMRFSSSFAWLSQMTVRRYVTYDESDPRFDGHIARRHLEQHLAMEQETPESAPGLGRIFSWWIDGFTDAIVVHPRGPVFLVPPRWFS